MFNRSVIVAAAFVLLAGAAPVYANAVHAEKGASGQGLLADAFFDSPTTVNGINVTPFNDQGTIYDIFQIPGSFTTGTPFELTFNDITAGYGIFDCDNGTSGTPISADMPPLPLPGAACTVGPVGSNEAFVSFNEVGNTSTISFLGGAGAPSTFYFWTADGNLTDISPVNATAPEPASLALLAAGLAGLALLRRRTALDS
jgi:hypothetical protein